MKKSLLVLAASSMLATACQMPAQLAPAQPVNQLRAAATSLHAPDFLRKMSNPAAYRFQGDMASRSICGPNDLQQVNSYDGSLGQPVDFVVKHKAAVAALAQGTPENSRKFCSGTLISEDLFLTANHCVDPTITQKFAVFNYETAPGSSNLLPQDHYKVAAIVEEGKGLDYAIIRIEGKPGLKYGWTKVLPVMPEKGHLLTIIQHPKGQPKQVESGPVAGEEGNYMLYSDLDTEPGSSGSGVLNKDGLLVGVHTNGGCGSDGGANRGVKMTAIYQASKALQTLYPQNSLRR